MKILKGLEEGQVLQRLGSRGATVKLSGEVAATGPILATISGAKEAVKGGKRRVVGKSRAGVFSITLSGIPAGGPYRLQLQAGKEKVVVRAFFVGDVWIMVGQSNMEGVGNMPSPAKPHPLVRAFSMRHQWRLATDPLHLLGESPDACHNGGTQISFEAGEKARHNAGKGVGVGLFFAREMLRESGVPQGLIAAAHGGTSMIQWDPASKNDLYASMLGSVRATAQPVAGVLWYQGESETDQENVVPYTERMKKLVAATRRDLAQPRLPWVAVQLARVFEVRDDVSTWNRVQEQQRLLPREIKHLETVAAIDLPLDDLIHIGAESYRTLGLRMAYAAHQLLHGGKMRPPQLKKIVMGKAMPGETRIDVIFDSVEKELWANGEPQGFTLVDGEGKPTLSIFKTTLIGNMARLHCSRVPFGARLHYGYGTAPTCNIVDARGFSLPVFGPASITGRVALLPFIKRWKTSGVVSASKPLGKIACPDLDVPDATVKSYDATIFGLEGFINEHESWNGKSGQCYFAASLQVDEPTKLALLMGYDGPFRLWVDGKPFFQDLKGTNPCFPDQSKVKILLKAGTHRITVAMDLNGGVAWGFFLRFAREDLSLAQIEQKDYAIPSYST